MLLLFLFAGSLLALDFRNVNQSPKGAQEPTQPFNYVNPYGELRQFLSTQRPSFPIQSLAENQFNFTAEQLAMLGLTPQQFQGNTDQDGNFLESNPQIAPGSSGFPSDGSENGNSISFHSYNSGSSSSEQQQPKVQSPDVSNFGTLSTPKNPKKTTTTAVPTTPFIWTTTKKPPAKLSKLSGKAVKNETSANSKVKTAAHISVPSHRLLNDILVIPSSRRLYVLAILPIHESADNKGFDCGRVDVDGFIRLAAFLDALNQVNSGRTLKDAGLSLGAVIVDSCASDLRTVADLYELLSGTNIHKSDLVAIVRDDGSHLPNVDDFARHLKIPILNTFFTRQEQPLTTGTLPSIASPIEAMLDMLVHTRSSCVSVIYDDLFEEATMKLSEMASKRDICVEQRLSLNGGIKSAEAVVRRLLLTEARVAIVLLGEFNWQNLMKAFRNEMVIAGRFILLSIQDPRWQSAKSWTVGWPHFDQLLLSVTPRRPPQSMYLHQLAQMFPNFPFPQHWLRQFWSTAFKCHIEGEKIPGEQFSKECSHKQTLNLTRIAPDINVAPIQIAVHSLAHSMRKMVDNVCPGALISTLTDCINDPQESLFGAVMSLDFSHGLAEGGVVYNESSGFRDSSLVINRVIFDAQLEYDQLATWDSIGGLQYSSPVDLIMEERDGTRVPLRSTCPKSACSLEMARRALSGSRPTIRTSLDSFVLLAFAVGATLSMFVCLMCMYQQMIAAKMDSYKICTMFSFGGLSMLCLCSIFFIMPPNSLSCSVRRIGFSISLAATLAPVMVKTLFVWRSEFQSISPSQMLMFWVCMGVVTLQTVIAVEWMVFESPTDLSFASSAEHGSAWRCTPGNDFEARLFNSCLIPFISIILSLVCSIVSIKHVESRQNVVLTFLSIGFSVSTYVVLPMLPYSIRDPVMAGAILLFCYLFLVVSYCTRVFSKSDDEMALQEKRRPDRENSVQLSNTEFWISRDQLMSPNGVQNMTMQRNTIQRNNYHQASTLPHKAPIDGISHHISTLPHAGYRNTIDGRNSALDHPSVSRRNSIQMNPNITYRTQQPYGTNVFDHSPKMNNFATTGTLPHPTHNLPSNLGIGKYGTDKYVEESEHL